MKITIEEPIPGQEEEIIVRCNNIDADVMKLILALKEGKTKLTGYSEEGISILMSKEIYYFEAVDNKVFAYTKDKVYEVKNKLYEIEEKFEGSDFLRVSKSTIANISKIAQIAPRLNGRFDATMKNKEIITVSRQYVGLLKEKLGI